MNLLAIKDLDVSFGDSLIVLLLGMAIVMAVLAVIIGLIKIIKLVLDAIEGNKKAEQVTAAVTQSEPQKQQTVQEDEETVAAIAAAISCMLESEKQGATADVTAPFVIKKIKRIR